MGSLNLIDIEQQIEARYVKAFKAIFEKDDTFVYNEDDKLTKLIITPEFPEKDATLKTPHLVVTNITYNFNCETSFYSNYYMDIFDDEGRQIGKRYLNIIPYSLGLVCLSEYFVSKDLANRALSYLTFTAKELFDSIYIKVGSVSKNPTSPHRQYPEHIFETTLSVQGNLEWEGNKIRDLELLNMIKILKTVL